MPGEDVNRKIERLADHDERMRRGYVRAREAFYGCNRRLAHALEDRSGWRTAVTLLVHDHIAGPRGHCDKCKQPYPCETVRILRSVNYGYYKYTERFAGFSDEEVWYHTNPQRTAERDHWPDHEDETSS